MFPNGTPRRERPPTGRGRTSGMGHRPARLAESLQSSPAGRRDRRQSANRVSLAVVRFGNSTSVLVPLLLRDSTSPSGPAPCTVQPILPRRWALSTYHCRRAAGCSAHWCQGLRNGMGAQLFRTTGNRRQHQPTIVKIEHFCTPVLSKQNLLPHGWLMPGFYKSLGVVPNGVAKSSLFMSARSV